MTRSLFSEGDTLEVRGYHVIKKLTKHGNSLALVIDRPILDLINVNPEKMAVQITTDGNNLILSPVRDIARRRKFEAAVEKANKKYSRMFKRLAE
jgi:antitoxin component of MazEF toxin-antitoxin module